MMPSTTSDAGTALQGTRLLVVEDDVLLLMELECILVDAGAEVVGFCRTIDDALAAADMECIAAAILDVRVGRKTISPVARRLASRGTPFIFYTGQVEGDPELAEWRGCTVLSKPARPGAIVAAVVGLLQQHGRAVKNGAPI